MMKLVVNRDRIIEEMKKRFITENYIYAYWLEGADGLGALDEFSDIDIWLDVEDGFEGKVFEMAEEVLTSFGVLDFNYEKDHPHPKIFQKYYHIEGSTEYLLIDFCIQSHSRDKTEVNFVEGDILEFPKVIFDKANIVSIQKDEIAIDKELLKSRVNEIIALYKQHSRVIKYIERKKYTEAYIYYIKYVADPLVELMRIKYTPKYHYLHLIHISDHLPIGDVQILEEFYKVSCLEDIRIKTKEARVLFSKLIDDIYSVIN